MSFEFSVLFLSFFIIRLFVSKSNQQTVFTSQYCQVAAIKNLPVHYSNSCMYLVFNSTILKILKLILIYLLPDITGSLKNDSAQSDASN